MKKILRISAFMLFALIGVHLSFAGAREKYKLKVTAEVASSDYSYGKVAAQFESISGSGGSSSWNGSSWVTSYEYSKSAPTPPETFNDYRTKGLTSEAKFNSYYYEGGIDMGVYLYAEPYVRTNGNEVADGDMGYAFDYWEITGDDGINMKSYVQNLYFVWNHKNKSGDDPNNPTEATLRAVAHFKRVDSTVSSDVTKVKGYFRIQNEATDKYVDVTGPFSAAPSLDYKEAESSAGTVMYVEAVEDGDSYRLTHLRSQGIDVVATDRLSSDEYINTLADLQDLVSGAISGDNNFNDIAYGLVGKGFTHGYTNIARATVGTVFWIVAGALGERMDEGEVADGYTAEDYIAVAENFNKYVTATLDLGIRMKPVEGKENTVQVYFDVPSFQCVSNWYNTRFATISTGKNRHDVFASAMRSMSTFLKNRFKMDLETFYAADIKLFNDWGYDITEDYTVNKEGNIELDFDRIFSDPILLFNWIKMVGYYIINPDADNSHGLSGLGFGDLAGNLDQHYLTRMLKSYLPRIHHNSRAYLINGRVGSDDKAGGSFDTSEIGTLGFASGAELATAGTYANWKLCPIDNIEQKFVVNHKHPDAEKFDGTKTLTFGASALYYDFPVQVREDNATSIFTLSKELFTTTIKGSTYTFNMVEPKEVVAPGTPFLIKTPEGESSQLDIPNDWVFGEVVNGSEPEEFAKMSVYAETEAPQSPMAGVFLRTSLNDETNMSLYGLEKDDIYTLSQFDGTQYKNLAFTAPTDDETYLHANEAVYLISSMEGQEPVEIPADQALASLENSFVYIGEPEVGEEPENPAVTKIKGYFRIQNVGNEKYVEVTGPFTARPDQDYTAAEKSAGTIMYVEAVQDGDADSYRITHLRSQGIDVVSVKDLSADDYLKVLENIDILNAGEELFNTIAYELVRQGYQYGYTNIGRATVGSVFLMVASLLDTFNNSNKSGQLEGYEYQKGDYYAVAADFNREVTAKLDLGIRMEPVSFEDKTVRVYFDVPSLKPVCEWYKNPDATIESEDGDKKNRHDVFASAMLAMGEKMKDYHLETFYDSDIKLFKSWGYDIAAKYSDAKNGDNIELKFHDIFSDEILLFNWIKMIGYYLLNPEKDTDHKIGEFFGGVDLAGAAKKHYLTGMLVNYLPRIHPNSRAYLINGRVGDDDKAGGTFNESEVGTLGFASRDEVATADKYANWRLCPVDNKSDNGKFMVSVAHETDFSNHDFKRYSDLYDEAYYNAFCFDFPVSAADDNTNFYTMGEIKEKTATTGWWSSESNTSSYTVYYTDIVEIEDEVLGIQTPFILQSKANAADIQLMVGNGSFTYDSLNPADNAQPDNSFVMGDDETVDQYSFGGELRLLAVDDENEEPSDKKALGMVGVLLKTQNTPEELQKNWNISPESYTYTFGTTEFGGKYNAPVNSNINTHLSFSDEKKESIGANEVIFASPYKINYGMLLFGEPTDDSIVTGVEGVTVDNSQEMDNTYYNLQGIRVANPIPGNIYIINGRKIVFK